MVLLALLAAAGCRTAGGGVRTEGPAAAKAPAPIEMVLGGTAQTSVDPGTLGPFPLDGAFVYQPDPRCTGTSNRLPDLAVAVCMRSKAIEWMTRETQAGRVKPGPKFSACSYPSDPNWNNCIEYTLRNATPEIRWGQSPVWVAGAIEGVPWTGCAAGVSYAKHIRVSLADDSRIQRLVAWETANVLLAYTLDRYVATDGPIVGAATNYAAQACGVP